MRADQEEVERDYIAVSDIVVREYEFGHVEFTGALISGIVCSLK